MSVDTFFESLKNILGIMDNLVLWALRVEYTEVDYIFEGVCSFKATNDMLVFANYDIDKGAASKTAFTLTKAFLSDLLEKGFEIEFEQRYRPATVELVFRLHDRGNMNLEVEVLDVYYDVADEAIKKIMKEIYRIRGVRESKEGEQNVRN